MNGLRKPAGLATLAGLGACTLLLAPLPSHAVQVNLSTTACGTYENEVLTGTLPGYTVDSINTVMWLFGFSIARSGERFMYGDSLKPFGYALDGVCKNFPDMKLLDAVTSVKSDRRNPMDLTVLKCATFGPRHESLRQSDPESATTLTLWMYGYSVGLSKDQIFDSDNGEAFNTALETYCAKNPEDSLYDALHAMTSKSPHPKSPRKRPKMPPAATPQATVPPPPPATAPSPAPTNP